jgi:hypothetical protein
MPFDPRLIQPDDAPLLPDGEIDLPPDLAALGEQLRDDALHLAARYQPGSAVGRELVQPASASRVRSRTWKKVAVLATSGLATVLAGVLDVQMLGSRQANPRVAVAPDAPQENPSEPAAIPASLPTSIGSPPMVSLTELSGPELEALLDLWQREPGQAERTGVSF